VVYLDYHFWTFSTDQPERILAGFPKEDTVPQRFDLTASSPEGMQAMLGLAAFVKRGSHLEPSLLELIKIRISQINGCAFCLAMHVAEARSLGETDERLHLLTVWPETPLFTRRERAALAWVEAVARLRGGEVPDPVYAEVTGEFSEPEIAHLTFAAVEISGWNRLMIASRTPPRVSAA